VPPAPRSAFRRRGLGPPRRRAESTRAARQLDDSLAATALGEQTRRGDPDIPRERGGSFVVYLNISNRSALRKPRARAGLYHNRQGQPVAPSIE
jgi:hypothetical protein